MTLQRRLLLVLSVMLLGLWMVFLSADTESRRNTLQQQLDRHISDAVVLLQQTIQKNLAASDHAELERMADTVFDRGYYRSLAIHDRNGLLLVSRHKNPPQSSTPDWFMARYPLIAASGKGKVLYEGEKVGSISLVSETDGVYRWFWMSAKNSFDFVLKGIMLSGLVLFMLLRFSFRPLKVLEQQAQAICKKDFSFHAEMPDAKDLKRISKALNFVAQQVKQLFDEQVMQIERLRNQSYVDPETGLGNARFFNAQLQARLFSTEEPYVGALARLQLDGIEQYRELNGQHEAGQLLRRVGIVWRKAIEEVEGPCVAYVSDSCFSALLPHLEKCVAEQKISEVLDKVSSMPEFAKVDGGLQVYAGMSYCRLGDSARALGPQAEKAVQQAKEAQHETSKDSLVEVFDEVVHGEPVLPRQPQVGSWEEFLKQLIDNERIEFHFQPVCACENGNPFYYEALARIDVDGNLLNAGVFVPIIEQFHMEIDFDKLVIKRLMQYLKAQPNDNRHMLSVNVSSHSVRDEAFLDWLLVTVGESPELAPYLIFEVPELSIRSSHGKLKRLASGLQGLGAKLTIDHFGTTNSSFGYLSGLPLFSIKIDHSYIRDIDVNREHQMFVQSLVCIARSRNILLTAEMVEAKSQWELLTGFQLDGAQGYYLGEPKALTLTA